MFNFLTNYLSVMHYGSTFFLTDEAKDADLYTMVDKENQQPISTQRIRASRIGSILRYQKKKKII